MLPIYIYNYTKALFQRNLITIEYFTNLSVDLGRVGQACLGVTASWVVTFGLSLHL